MSVLSLRKAQHIVNNTLADAGERGLKPRCVRLSTSAACHGRSQSRNSGGQTAEPGA